MADGRGNIYVNRAGFNPMAGEEFRPGFVFLAAADGSVRQVADDIAFPNGMAVTADNSTLIVADSYRHNLVAFDIGADGGLSGRRIWAHVGDGVPDGICTDEQDAVWYADVPNQRCVRVAEGGAVLQTVAARPRLLRLRAGRARPQHAVHRGRQLAGHDRTGAGRARQRPGSRHRRRRARGRLAVTPPRRLAGVSTGAAA